MEMKADNAMEVIFDAKSENESFARVTAAAFCTRLDPTVEEIADIKTAVSEAVTNSIVHGYEGIEGKITLKVSLVGQEVRIEVHDDGIGIENVEQWSRFIQPNRSRNVPEWDFPLWKLLWMS